MAIFLLHSNANNETHNFKFDALKPNSKIHKTAHSPHCLSIFAHINNSEPISIIIFIATTIITVIIIYPMSFGLCTLVVRRNINFEIFVPFDIHLWEHFNIFTSFRRIRFCSFSFSSSRSLSLCLILSPPYHFSNIHNIQISMLGFNSVKPQLSIIAITHFGCRKCVTSKWKWWQIMITLGDDDDELNDIFGQAE